MKRGKHLLWIAFFGGFLAFIAGCVSASAQSYAYVPNGTTVSVIDTGTNTVVDTISGLPSPFGVALTPNGAFAYVTSLQGTTVSVIDRTNTVVATVPGLSGPFGIAVAPNGTFACVANLTNGSVGILNTATNTLATTISLPSGSLPIGVVISPNSALAYVSNQGTNTVSVISTATNALVATVPVGTRPAFLAISPNGAFVYVPNLDSATVSVISTATNSVVATVPVGNNPVSVAIRPDGAIAYASNSADNTVSEINTGTNTVIDVVPAGTGPNGIAFTRDGSFAYVVNQTGGTVSVIETASSTVVATIPIVAGAQTIAISPADDDSGLSQLNGGNSFTGNQTVNGNVTATSFSGSGSGLTGVNAATAATASGLNCAGCVGNPQLGVNYAGSASQGGAASNALLFGGLAPSAFPTLGGNTFTGQQFMPALSVSSNSGSAAVTVRNSFATGIQANGVDYGVYGSGAWGLYGSSTSAVGVGVQGVGSGAGVAGESYDGAGVSGVTLHSGVAGVFNATNGGKILSGQSNGTEVFSVANNGNVATIGSVTIGGGTPIVEYVSTTDSLTVPALTPGSCTTFTTAALTGFTPGTSDTIALGTPASLVSSFFLQYQAWETTTTSSPTITVQVCNPTGVKYKGGATGTIRIDVFKH